MSNRRRSQPKPRLSVVATAVLAILAVTVLASACSSLEREEAIPRVSMVAETVEGDLIDVGPLLSQDALVWFWAPW